MASNSKEKKQILLIEDDPSYRYVLGVQLAGDDRDVLEAADVEAGIAAFRENHVDLILTDMRLGARHKGGLEVLRASIADDPLRPVILLTAHGTILDAVEATQLGALDYVQKPHDDAALGFAVEKALRTRELSGLHATRDAPTSAPSEDVRLGVRSRSAAMIEVYEAIERVADAPTRVLITGETGTGKELVARALHLKSRRRERPFLPVNCGAIPRDLMEAELFGFEKGAFTGASYGKPGKFEMASGGTIFLDEVGDLPRDMQVKLLRVLQEQEIERIGGLKTIRVDVRVIAATHRDLKREVAQGTFREDLYHRLCVVEIPLPPLRERPEDIPPLCAHFLTRFNERLGKRVLGIEPAALARLVRHPWSGNIRELENVMERAVLFTDGRQIRSEDLRPDLRGNEAAAPPEPSAAAPSSAGALPPRGPASAELDFSEGLKERSRAIAVEFERDVIVRTLAHTRGNVTEAARCLKLSRKGLQLKMKDLGLRDPSPEGPGEGDADPRT
ncbi:MAG: sigma-54 dependent transcriptional regulator [Byssovorax sp.]